jgi:L-asparagine transporter-like permease
MNQNFGSELLFIMLVYLKLTNQTDISWWWVTAPMWVIVLIGVMTIDSEDGKNSKDKK